MSTSQNTQSMQAAYTTDPDKPADEIAQANQTSPPSGDLKDVVAEDGISVKSDSDSSAKRKTKKKDGKKVKVSKPKPEEITTSNKDSGKAIKSAKSESKKSSPSVDANATAAAAFPLQNMQSADPFAETEEVNNAPGEKQAEEYIHIRIQQRNGRKTLTTIQGVPERFDQKEILRHIKKKFACNGTLVSVEGKGEKVIQLQGDQRKVMREFLSDKKRGLSLDKQTVKVHGF